MKALAWLAALGVSALLCVAAARAAARAGAESSPWRRAAARLMRDRTVVLALFLVIAVCVIAILAPALAPWDPAYQPHSTSLLSQPPSPAPTRSAATC